MTYMELLGHLGRGAYGTVYKAKFDNRIVAVKRLYVDKRTSFIGSLRELDILQKCRGHPHIVNLITIAFTQPFDQLISPVKDENKVDEVWLVTEFWGQDLQNYLYPYNRNAKAMDMRRLSQQELLEISFQMLVAVDFIHGRGIIHRDIKPGNFLIETNPTRIKLNDFGLSRYVCNWGCQTPRISTPVYRAPEICLGNSYNTAIDAWSLGCILYQLVTAKPFVFVTSDDCVAVLRQIYRTHPDPLGYHELRKLAMSNDLVLTDVFCNKPRASWNELLRGCDLGLKQIIIGLLDMDPSKRWTVGRALQHEYWANWQFRLKEIHQHFAPIQVYPLYQIELYKYTSILITYIKDIILTCRLKEWFRLSNMFILVNLVYRYTANLTGQVDSLIPSAQLHIYVLLYMVIKYSTSLGFNPDWEQVVPANFNNNSIITLARQYERDILRVVDYQIYSPTPYDVSTKALDSNTALHILAFMLLEPMEIKGKTATEVLQLALNSKNKYGLTSLNTNYNNINLKNKITINNNTNTTIKV